MLVPKLILHSILQQNFAVFDIPLIYCNEYSLWFFIIAYTGMSFLTFLKSELSTFSIILFWSTK